MSGKLADDMRRAVEAKVRSMHVTTATVDVNAAAEEIRRVFAERNVPHAEIAASVAQFATQCGYPVELAAFAPQTD